MADPDNVKSLLKKLAPPEFLPIALALDKKSGELIVDVHKARNPKKLGESLKDETGSGLVSFGTVTPDVAVKSTIIFVFQGGKKIPSIEQKFGKYLKANSMPYKSVRVVDVEPKNEPAISKSEQRSLEKEVIDTATAVATGARVNALNFGQQVTAACTAFRKYSMSGLEELAGEITAGDLLGPLVTIVTGGVTGAVANTVGDVVGKFFVKEITKLANDKIVAQAKSVGNDSGDLKKAVEALVVGATDLASAMGGVVERSIVPLCDKVVKEVNKGNTLDPRLTAFIEPFIRASTSEVDRLLEQRFGIPTAAKAQKTQREIYRGLVEKFEKKLIIAKIPSSEKMEWNVRGVPQQIDQAAKSKAQQAATEREREMNTAR